MINLLNNVVNSFEQVIIEVVDLESDIFKLVAGECYWAQQLFPLSNNNKPFKISEELPFLQDFLIDAKLIWNDDSNARIKSGFWTETLNTNNDIHLEAIAIKHNQQNILVVSNQSEEFKLRQNTMQSARELILFNDQLLEKNEYFQIRLRTILKEHTEKNKTDLLIEIIEKARFSVLITKSDLTTMVFNSETSTLFEENNVEVTEPSQPIDILIKLLTKQLPEYERIISTKSNWEGELCWMSPPSTLKWLKVSLYPVKNEVNDILNWIVFVNDITNIKYLVQRNEQLAFQDMLTELPNRLSFLQTLDKQVIAGDSFYLLYIDINEFRRHNEFFGHDEGDNLLIEFSNRLKKSVKKSDYIGRIGGDEFAILLTNVNNQQDCIHIVERIIDSIEKPFTTCKSVSFNVSISIGAANFPLDTDNAQDLMKFVDLSTHNGKGSINNSLQFYSQTIKDASHQLIEMEYDLKLAIKNSEFELFLQPIVNLKDNKIIKAEALIRWYHPKKGMISPQDFIPIAEKSDLIIAIGKWVITSSCQLVQKFADIGHHMKISINLSPVQVLDDNLFTYLSQCIKHYNIDPTLLELELTEGILVDDYSKVEDLLSKVRKLGLSVSVDDFGTGYSSLAHLKKLPLDFLKIDRTFVQDIVNDDNDKAIVKAVISMAHNLNLGVIAEGVETKEQLDFLTTNYCDSVQGYLFSKPVDFYSFTKLLEQDNLLDLDALC